ncbi:hypothetical protein AB1Y20_012598 [Prymnesium parvum]|uniref:EF-hand domain-containing protein n=1 Tax=Prymnesium parvum TaxID=97485 RepID=A0AB34ILX2_PRYPA|mmetsp:Transcript_9371/g.23321  ORF Transcript_9371/g.23321 Transcript_9371/m.23321 type:complete len:193 (+) Transcript_9371:17-595(+)
MPAAAAIAVARARKRKLKQQKLEHQRRVKAWFAKFDVNHSGVLEREQLRQLLLHLNPASPPDDAALDLLMEKAVAIDTTGDGQADTRGISQASAEEVVHKYSSYLAEKSALDGVFEEFDTNKTGQLEPDELHALLQKVCPGEQVSQHDVEVVLEMCDKDHKGAISRDEVLAACATWKAMVKQHHSSSACALL